MTINTRLRHDMSTVSRNVRKASSIPSRDLGCLCCHCQAAESYAAEDNVWSLPHLSADVLYS